MAFFLSMIKRSKLFQWNPRRSTSTSSSSAVIKFSATVFVTVIVLIFLFLLIWIFALNVFYARHTVVEYVRLAALDPDFSLPNLKLTLLISALSTIPTVSPSATPTAAPPTSATGTEAANPPGKIGSRGSAHLDIMLTVITERLIGDSRVYADLARGSLTLVTYTMLPGRVCLLGMDMPKISYTTCDVMVG